MTLVAPQVRPGARQRWNSIYGVIRERIALLDYEPGQRLSEEALAIEFGTSRTPIRRVLARLEDEGLLHSVQSVGTMVTDIDFETLAQVYRLRMELAELIGLLDPVSPTEAMAAAFREVRQRTDTVAHSPNSREFARINIDFFHALMNLTHNAPLREISERLYYQTTRIWIKSMGSLDLTAEIAIFQREVRDILAAIEIGDLAAVGHIRRSNISMSFQRLRRKGEVDV
ncbi:MAG: GntR family transcriptional regulator [Paracoccaceae bacterium]